MPAFQQENDVVKETPREALSARGSHVGEKPSMGTSWYPESPPGWSSFCLQNGNELVCWKNRCFWLCGFCQNFWASTRFLEVKVRKWTGPIGPGFVAAPIVQWDEPHNCGIPKNTPEIFFLQLFVKSGMPKKLQGVIFFIKKVKMVVPWKLHVHHCSSISRSCWFQIWLKRRIDDDISLKTHTHTPTTTLRASFSWSNPISSLALMGPILTFLAWLLEFLLNDHILFSLLKIP